MAGKRSKVHCNGQTKHGKPCHAAATPGGLCFFHANPDKASELGRIGGSRNRRANTSAVDPLPTLDDALAIRKTIDRLVADVHSGKLHPRIAASIAPLLNLQLRAIEATTIQDRLTKLENILSQNGAQDRNEKVTETGFEAMKP